MNVPKKVPNILSGPVELNLPKEIDHKQWIQRWDRMQERYLAHRAERFEIMARIIQATQENVSNVLDLGCGTGSLMAEIMDVFPDAKVYGIDFDPTLLPLARARLQNYGARAALILSDLRAENWMDSVPVPIDAIVSATALHWLKSQELEKLYQQIARLLRSGGIFISADHVASGNESIQKAWAQERENVLKQRATDADTWEDFWQAYMKAWGRDTFEIYQRVLHSWEGGVEEGMPLAWHFDKLRKAGFPIVDCFWRYNCDAIYGGILEGKRD